MQAVARESVAAASHCSAREAAVVTAGCWSPAVSCIANAIAAITAALAIGVAATVARRFNQGRVLGSEASTIAGTRAVELRSAGGVARFVVTPQSAEGD